MVKHHFDVKAYTKYPISVETETTSFTPTPTPTHSTHKPMTASYPFVKTLAESHQLSSSTTIYTCVYRINTSCKYPFLEILLYAASDGHFIFPSFDHSGDDDGEGDVKHACNAFLHKIFGEKELLQTHYKGVISYKDNFVVFVKHEFKELNYPSHLSAQDKWWWVTMSEIINYKKVMYFKIDTFVTDFFVTNSSAIFLYDGNNNVIETPTICYFGDEYNKIVYFAMFGELKASIKSSFGPYYVFTNFLSSMMYACYSYSQQPFTTFGGEEITTGKYGKYKDGGILRAVLFVGKIKVFLTSDEDDKSQITQKLAKENDSIKQLMSLRDSNGNWTEHYDTAYTGLYFVDVLDPVTSKKMISVNTVEWFFKDYNNSVILSYHKVNTDDIPDKYNVNYTNYKII